MGLGIEALRTLAFVVLVFGSQATIYAIRQRRHLWGIRPSLWLAVSSVADIVIASTLAIGGIAMTPLPALLVAGTLAAAAVFAVLDLVKVPAFRGLGIASEPPLAAESMKMRIISKDFRVREGDEVNLKKWPTKVDPVYKSKEQYKTLLQEHVAQLNSQQQLLYEGLPEAPHDKNWSGTTAIARLRIWRDTSTRTVPASSSSSSTFPKKNSESALPRADRRKRQELEIQFSRHCRERILEAVHESL